MTQQVLRVVTLLQRHPDLTHEEFLAHWREVHAPLALRLPGLLGYSQTEVLCSAHPPEPGAIEPDGLADLRFGSWAARQAADGSPEGRALMADGARFVGRGHSWVVGLPHGLGR